MSRLSSALVEAINEEFPSIKVGPEAGFFVHPRPEVADFSSIAAIRIAAIQKIDATVVATQLLRHLERSLPGIWRDEAGYMTVAGSDDEWWSDELKSCHEARVALLVPDEERTILCLVPYGTLPEYAALRLVALAGTQAWLLVSQGCACRVSFAVGKVRSVSTTEAVVAAVSEAVLDILRVKGPSEATRSLSAIDVDEFAKMLPERPEGGIPSWGTTFLWINHQTLSRLPGPVKSLIEARRRADQIVLRMPNDGWILSRERAIPEILDRVALTRVVDRISSSEGWLHWLLHAASSIPSGEFDPSVGLFEEMASPGWALRELHERLTRVTTGAPLGAVSDPMSNGSDAGGTLPRELRATWLAALSLPSLVTRGAFSGDVLDAMRAIERCAASGHAFLNNPTLRLRLHRGQTTYTDRKILAGLCFTLSSILRSGSESLSAGG